MAIKMLYKGVDISDKIDVFRCWHEMNAAGRADIVRVSIEDTYDMWDKWQPQRGDEISLIGNDVETGTMYINSLSPENGLYTIEATSTPISAFERKNKAWQDVRLLQIGAEIARLHGLNFKAYDVDNYRYSYLMQDNISDMTFLNRMCILEGCAFLVFNKTLVMYSESKREAVEAETTLEINNGMRYKLYDNSGQIYGECRFNKGNFIGGFSPNNGIERVFIPSIDFNVSSNAEANRFAKNLLRNANKGAYTGDIYINGILKGIAPASIVALKIPKAQTWNGNVFVTRVRNDYIRDTTKITFRRMLGGY